MITEADADLIGRIRKRLERGVPPQRELNAGEERAACELLVRLHVAFEETLRNLILVSAERDAMRAQIEDRARQDTLSMQLGEARKDASR